MKKLISVALAGLIFFIGWLSHDLYSEKKSDQQNTKLFLAIEKDLNELQNKNLFPVPANEIAFLQYNFSTPELAKLFGTNSQVLQTHPAGNYFVDSEVFMKADENDVVIYQFSFHEKKSKNKIAEISREYRIQ